MNKIIIAGIIGSFSILSLIIWFEVLTDTEYKIVEEITMHPCQKLVLELMEANLEWRYYNQVFSSAPYPPQSTFVTEPFERQQVLQEKLLDSGCYDKNNNSPAGNWATVEFQEKLTILNYEGFHP